MPFRIPTTNKASAQKRPPMPASASPPSSRSTFSKRFHQFSRFVIPNPVRLLNAVRNLPFPTSSTPQNLSFRPEGRRFLPSRSGEIASSFGIKDNLQLLCTAPTARHPPPKPRPTPPRAALHIHGCQTRLLQILVQLRNLPFVDRSSCCPAIRSLAGSVPKSAAIACDVGAASALSATPRIAE